MGRKQDEIDSRLTHAVRRFWSIRDSQAAKQGGENVQAKDRGARGAVTGGKQMDGFVSLVRSLLVDAGLAESMVYCRSLPQDSLQFPRIKGAGARQTQTKLPGWFRAEKDWDLVVIVNGTLVAAIEFKSQVGSFGNNFNNRTEEALGSSSDIIAAYREGAFKPSIRPWIGYLMLLEEAPGSTRPVKTVQPHFKVFDEFNDASYAKRYEILLTKLVRERLYDSACFLMSRRDALKTGEYSEPCSELCFRNFITSLVAHATTVLRMDPRPADSSQQKS